MKNVIVFCAALLPCFILFSQENDFRSANWGSSLTTIKRTEKAHFSMKIKDNELVYHDQMDGEDCQVYYIFNGNDKLECGIYHFTKKYINPQFYVDAYNKFRSLLVEKYGQTSVDSEDWNSNATVSDKQNLGQAVAAGNLSLNSIWQTGRSVIKIVLVTGSNKQPVIQIHYSTRSLDQLENQADLRAALGKL